MKNQSERMTVILSRILSEEVAHQELWKKSDIERFGECTTDRDGIIEEIKQFMDDNGIPFNYDSYFSI